MSIFLRSLLPDSPWLIAVLDGDRKAIKTFAATPREREVASTIIDCNRTWNRQIRVLAGKTKASLGLLSRAPEMADLEWVCAVGIRLPIGAKDSLPKLQHAPAHYFVDPDPLFPKEPVVAVWRFEKPVSPKVAVDVEEALARQLGGKRLNFFITVPRDNISQKFGYERIEGAKDIAGLRIEAAPVAPAKPEKGNKFVRGDAQDDEAEVPDLKEDWVASEGFTYYVGRPKQGKSLALAKTAAYITAGGTWDAEGKWTTTWFDGSPIAPYARGSVIIGEQEDKVSQTKARCRAAGCDMSKVHIRKMLPDISVPGELKEWTDLAEQLGDCRMMAFSPILEALKIKDNAEAAVRRKFAPILAWAEGRNIALTGVLHTDKDGKSLAGSDVLFRIARCVIQFEDGVMSVRDSNIGPTGMQVPFRVAKIVSQGVKTARMEFLEAGEVLPEVAGDRLVERQNSLYSEYCAPEPSKRYTPTEIKYIAFLRNLLPPLTEGGVPLPGPEVRKAARGGELTNIEALLRAADEVGIERRRRPGAAKTEPDLWVPPSEYPTQFDNLHRL